ncbi:MAG: 30S ribosomal protein S7 [Roseiflexaceae bacterium]|jgi:small subunit ribosomal protein S7
MPRRGTTVKREVLPDSRYGSAVISHFINKTMMRGKKSLAETIVYGALEMAADRLKKTPMEVLDGALRNAGPVIEVKPRRVGGATYQVPVEVKAERRQSLAIRWLLASARSRSGKPMVERLALELVDAFNNTGTTIKKREDVQRMAEANRAFSHYGRF